MLPLRDDQPRYSVPYITYFLIGLNLLIFLFEAVLEPAGLKNLVFQFGVVPANLTAFLAGSPKYPLVAVMIPFFTSMFLHGSWMHVIGNMWFLHIFGDNVEDYLGHFKYLVFYLLAGPLAMGATGGVRPRTPLPPPGGEGGLGGVVGGFFNLLPGGGGMTWF